MHTRRTCHQHLAAVSTLGSPRHLSPNSSLAPNRPRRRNMRRSAGVSTKQSMREQQVQFWTAQTADHLQPSVTRMPLAPSAALCANRKIQSSVQALMGASAQLSKLAEAVGARLRCVDARPLCFVTPPVTGLSWLVRRKRVPHALHRTGLDGGPRRHCGDSAMLSVLRCLSKVSFVKTHNAKQQLSSASSKHGAAHNRTCHATVAARSTRLAVAGGRGPAARRLGALARTRLLQ